MYQLKVKMEGGVCAWVGVMDFNHKNVDMYNRVAKGEDRVHVVSKMNLVIKRESLKYVHEVKIVREEAQVISDHSFVLCYVKVMGTQMKRKEEMNGDGIIRIEKLRENGIKKNKLGLLKLRWQIGGSQQC